jgi:hypothetical protein
MWRKSNMPNIEENQHEKDRGKATHKHANKPSHVRVRVFDMNVMDMSQ